MNPQTHPTIKPSDVRERIVGQHRAVGTKLDELSRAARTLLTGGPVALKQALELTRAVCDQLMKNIVAEGRILVPALRDTDAWGKIRADRLLGRLRTRRHELNDLRKSCVNAENETLAADLDRFIDDRRSDMERAERETLDRNVLRDDVIGIDSQGG